MKKEGGAGGRGPSGLGESLTLRFGRKNEVFLIDGSSR